MILHFSPTFSPALINSEDNLSSLGNNPAYSDPKETIIAPVKVAKSTINFGLYFFLYMTMHQPELIFLQHQYLKFQLFFHCMI